MAGLRRRAPMRRTGPLRAKCTDCFKRAPIKAKADPDRRMARDAVRDEVLRRDGGCVMRTLSGHECCGGMDVHEVWTRGRGGSASDPSNCITLCRCEAHRIATTEPRLAYELGLVSHSWEGEDGVVSARSRRLDRGMCG